MLLESYIVNIYRRERESGTVVGLVEKVGSEAEGVSAEGGPFSERTTIEDISPHGARLSVMHKMNIDVPVRLVIDPDHQAIERTAKVMRRVELAEKYEIGVSS